MSGSSSTDSREARPRSPHHSIPAMSTPARTSGLAHIKPVAMQPFFILSDRRAVCHSVAVGCGEACDRHGSAEKESRVHHRRGLNCGSGSFTAFLGMRPWPKLGGAVIMASPIAHRSERFTAEPPLLVTRDHRYIIHGKFASIVFALTSGVCGPLGWPIW
jgi:hypothetical protein